MRRSTFLGAATAAALAAGSLAVTMAPGSSHREAPKILADPTADNTDVYAFTAPDAPGSLTVVANWIPLEEPAGGPYFGKLDPEARYYVKIDNTGDGRPDVAYRWEFDQRFRNPNSFLDAAPTVDSIDDPDLNFVQTYDLYRETYRGRKVHARRIAQRRPGRAGQHRPEDDPGLRQGRGGRDHAASPAAARRSSARSTIRSSSTSAPSSTASTSTSRAARTSASATRAAARTTSRATTRTRSCCRCRRRRSRATARPSPGADATNAVVGVWATHRAPAALRPPPREGEGEVGPGQPARQPADQRGRHPGRPEGPLQPHGAGRRREELRHVRRRAGGRAAAQRAVRARRQDDRSHGHRAGAADRRPRADADRLQAGRGRHAEAQPRRAAGAPSRTASACSPATSPGSPTGAGSPTT